MGGSQRAYPARGEMRDDCVRREDRQKTKLGLKSSRKCASLSKASQVSRQILVEENGGVKDRIWCHRAEARAEAGRGVVGVAERPVEGH